MSQVCAFCPPPCRNTTRTGSVPQRSALIGAALDARDTAGSGPLTPACSAFSGR